MCLSLSVCVCVYMAHLLLGAALALGWRTAAQGKQRPAGGERTSRVEEGASQDVLCRFDGQLRIE